MTVDNKSIFAGGDGGEPAAIEDDFAISSLISRAAGEPKSRAIDLMLDASSLGRISSPMTTLL